MRFRRTWEIHAEDVHNPGFEISYIVRDGWEPFGVSDVPNTLDPNQVRLWLRRRSRRFWHRKPREIHIQSAGWGGHQVILHLTAGWEPFGLSITGVDQPIVWFRKAA